MQTIYHLSQIDLSAVVVIVNTICFSHQNYDLEFKYLLIQKTWTQNRPAGRFEAYRKGF